MHIGRRHGLGRTDILASRAFVFGRQSERSQAGGEEAGDATPLDAPAGAGARGGGRPVAGGPTRTPPVMPSAGSFKGGGFGGKSARGASLLATVLNGKSFGRTGA